MADADGRILWGRGYDEETQDLSPVPKGLLPHLTPDNPLFRHPNSETTLTGLVFIPEGPLLVASEHILSTRGGDAILGTVIMGRFLDDQEVQQLSELTRLSLTVATAGRRRDSPRLSGCPVHRLRCNTGGGADSGR